jgi:hypothetical protein
VIQEHADAALALLRAAPGSPALAVYPDEDGVVPDGLQPPYVRVYITVGRPGGTDLSGQSDVAECRIYTHSIGANDIAARAVAARVADALLDVTPTVPGRVCWPIRYEAGLPVQRDESTGQMVISQPDTYLFASLPG